MKFLAYLEATKSKSDSVFHKKYTQSKKPSGIDESEKGSGESVAF